MDCPTEQHAWFGKCVQRRRPFPTTRCWFTALTFLLFNAVGTSGGDYPTSPQIPQSTLSLVLEDALEMPLSSRTITTYPPAINYGGQLSRINFLRSEPGSAGAEGRLFVCDLNRSLYIVTAPQGLVANYINFEEVFARFDNNPGYAGGLVTFAFDPEYPDNGRFYTVHTEDPAKPGPAGPQKEGLPGLDLHAGYETTEPFNPPFGNVARESVLVEWTDSSINDTEFQGTARELLRIGFNGIIHPMGDLLFNPLATNESHPDFGNLYIANGDGAAGEQPDERHPVPQLLSALQGKLLRITPDRTRHEADLLSRNGRYRIPATGVDPNPFVCSPSPEVLPEIFAYGFRNPHRLTWDRVRDLPVVLDIGLASWEEINLVHKGGNYGYAEREGPEVLLVGGFNHGITGSRASPPIAFPVVDELYVGGLTEPVAPLYPATAYSHQDGDAISSGFFYRGRLVPALQGKFVFADITTARVFACDASQLRAADDSERLTMAPIEELRIIYGGRERRLFDLVAETYTARGGNSSSGVLPGGCGGLLTGGADINGTPYGCGRADVRIAEDATGELYVLSKSDGMIRRIVGTAVPPQLVASNASNGTMKLTWPAILNRRYQIQSRATLDAGEWSEWIPAAAATGPEMSTTVPVAPGSRFFRLDMVP